MVPAEAKKREPQQPNRRRFIAGSIGLGMGLMNGHNWFGGALPTGVGSNPAFAAPVPRRRRTNTAAPLRRVVDARVHINQVGFLPTEPKRAVVPATGAIVGNTFTIVDDDVTPQPRFSGKLAAYSGPNGPKYGHYDHHFIADFGDFRRPGRYRLRLSDGHLSPPFSIGSDVYSRLVPLVLKYFDVQRCGSQESEHRSHCHVDDGVISGGPRHGQRIDASGGWHDAGDYMKFVETTSYVTALMLFSYDRYHEQFPAHHHDSPLPELLSYAKIGLDWLLKMHPSPQEFYYQVGDATDHDTWRLPEDDCAGKCTAWEPRPVYFGVGANLAGRTAAAFAIASRLFRPYAPQYAQRCLAAAQSVYRLGLTNRYVLTTNPSDFYPEQTWADDMEWGAAALYHATQRPEYLQQALDFSVEAGAAGDQTSVYNTHALAHYTLYPHAPAASTLR